MGLICLINFIAIGGKKFWHWRKEKIAGSQNQLPNVQIDNNLPQNNGPFNNAIHNSDITSFQNIFFLVMTVVLGWIIRAVSLSFIDKSESNQVAINFLINYKLTSLFSLICAPLVLLVSKKEARQHFKFLFWNEWAPDFIQAYNPNRVHEIRLNQIPKV